MSVQPGGPGALLLQAGILFLGIGLLVANRFWPRGPAVTASGIFFINLFWITVILAYDLPLWSWLRNSAAGGIILLSIVALNLLAVVLLALFSRFFNA